MENHIRVLGAERRMTQEKLATAAGISRTALVQIEAGKAVPDGRTIAKLVKALGVPAGKIFPDLEGR